jgi:hypothetical protein
MQQQCIATTKTKQKNPVQLAEISPFFCTECATLTFVAAFAQRAYPDPRSPHCSWKTHITTDVTKIANVLRKKFKITTSEKIKGRILQDIKIFQKEAEELTFPSTVEARVWIPGACGQRKN